MSSKKLDIAAVESYAKSYATQLCNAYFAHYDRVNGETLLRFSDIPQVNLFVLRDLYETWKKTAVTFRSPYFNFENEEVKTALQTFLNIVSRHISLGRAELEPLLGKASHETLELLLQPEDYFEGWLRELPDFQLKADDFKPALKYTRLHTGVLKDLQDRLGSSPSVYTTQALQWLKESLPTQTQPPEETLAAFSAKVPLQIDSLYKSRYVAPAESPLSDSFFKQITPTEANVSTPITRTAEIPTPYAANSEPYVTIGEPTIVPQTPQITSAEDVTVSLNDQVSTFNEKLRKEKAGDSFASQFMHKPIESIHSYISLNHKFIFINQLFKGDSAAYHQAVDELEKASNFDKAKEIMNQTYATKYNWRAVVDEADDFYEIVRRRFNG
ncbi:MAG: hypothetical protein QM669_07500 [Siphonobacter sp.]